MIDFIFDPAKQTLTCKFAGELNSKTCADLAPLMDRKLAEVAPASSAKAPSKTLKIIFDLEQAPYVSSVFLRIVLLTAKKVTHGNFSVVKACQFVKDLFRSSGLEQLLRDPSGNIESALVSYPAVAEAAVVGRADDIKGSGLVAFVTLKRGQQNSPKLREALRDHVSKEVGAFAKPDEIRFAEALPKTRSGKIMRRLLKQVAAGTEITGDVTTLEDFGILERLSGEEG